MFISFVLAFIIAVFSFFQLASLPSLWVGVLLGGLLISSLIGMVWFIQTTRLTAFENSVNGEVNPSPLNRYTLIKTWLLNVYVGFIIGVCWVFGQTFFTVSMEDAWLNKPVTLQGTISGLVLQAQHTDRVRLRFNFKVDTIQLVTDSKNNDKSNAIVNATANEHLKNRSDDLTDIEPENSSKPSYKPLSKTQLQSKDKQAWSMVKPTLQLSWYLSQDQYQQLKNRPKTGQQWQFFVKLKANHAAMNLGALDYETWLYQNSITASGYVLHKPKKSWVGTLLKAQSSFNMRAWLAQRLELVYEGFALGGLYKALTYGDKSSISDAQWQVLQNTGTIHLMAISGLHMAIIAGLGYWLFKGIWWLGFYRQQRMTLPMFGALGAGLFASVYLVLSGYAIPTQRAYIMVLALLLFMVVRRTFQPWSALAFAAFLVVLWDSRSVLSLGFWLSFIAVGLIFAILQHPRIKGAPRWQQLLWIQFILTIGLAPYLIWAFHSLPSYSFISNLIAVPFVSFIGLPLLFGVSLVAVFSIELAQWCLFWVDLLWMLLWQGLQWVSTFEFSTLTFGSLSGWWLFLIYLLLFALLITRSWKLKSLFLVTIMGLLSVLLLENPRPQTEQAWLNVLDVGQGQAVVIETKNHVLVYDTGAKWGDKMDGAKLAILPFLRARGWTSVDHVMVSHSDLDHAGGLTRLLNGVSVQYLSSGQPSVLQKQLKLNLNSASQPTIQLCQAGQSWQWDGVTFQVLSPGLLTSDLALKLKSDNDQSCVLKVTAGYQSVLISGDLSSRGEKYLVTAYGDELKSTILVAGHHGSRYSTSSAWLDKVQPEVVLFSAGYKNRYRFPNADTLERLAPDVAWFNTACSGGIGYQLGDPLSLPDFDIEPTYQARKNQQKWYHHRCLSSEKGSAFQ